MKNECYDCPGEMIQEETGDRCLKCWGLYVNERRE